jgi:hypothetical protein
VCWHWQFNEGQTPVHLLSKQTNLYKDIAVSLKDLEWRLPGLVAMTFKLSASVDEHTPVPLEIPESYEPATGPNPWDASAIGNELAGEEGSARLIHAEQSLHPGRFSRHGSVSCAKWAEDEEETILRQLEVESYGTPGRSSLSQRGKWAVLSMGARLLARVRRDGRTTSAAKPLGLVTV